MSITTFVAMFLLTFLWLESRAIGSSKAPVKAPVIQAEEFSPLDP